VIRLKILACDIFQDKIKSYIEYTGDDFNDIRKKYIQLLMFSPIGVALILLMSFTISRFLLFSLIGYGIIVYFFPVIYSWSKKEEYRKVTNLESPLISLVCYVNSLIDKSLITTMEDLSKLKHLKTPSIESQMLKKTINILNYSSYKSIQRRESLHRGDLMGKIYSAYMVSMDMGVSLKDRLREAMKEILSLYKEDYRNYVNKATELSEVIFSIFLLLPIVLIGFQFTFKVSLFELLLPLSFAPLIVFLISIMQPNSDYDINMNWKQFIPVILSFVVALLLNVNLSIRFLIIVSGILVSVYLIYRQVRIANQLVKLLPDLLREVADYMKIGYSITGSLSKIRIRDKFGVVENIVKKSVLEGEVGEVKTPSKLFNNIIELFKIFNKSGTSYNVLEELAGTLNEIMLVQDSMTKQLRLFDAMVILTPVMLWITFSILGNISSDSATLSGIVVLLYSVTTSFIFSKLSRFTLFYFPTILMGTLIPLILSFIPHVF